jgi:hypothetical protein
MNILVTGGTGHLGLPMALYAPCARCSRSSTSYSGSISDAEDLVEDAYADEAVGWRRTSITTVREAVPRGRTTRASCRTPGTRRAEHGETVNSLSLASLMLLETPSRRAGCVRRSRFSDTRSRDARLRGALE